jgi:hypothetical protein
MINFPQGAAVNGKRREVDFFSFLFAVKHTGSFCSSGAQGRLVVYPFGIRVWCQRIPYFTYLLTVGWSRLGSLLTV